MGPIHSWRALFAVLLCSGLIAPPAEAQRAPVKAIWEPVNYPGDYRLNDVFFVNGEVGWVAGAARGGYGGVILHTRNGGEKWEVQLGDPASQDPEYRLLHFLDARHGWAVQYGWKLLRTSDGGKSWSDTGGVPGSWTNNLKFLTPQRGFATAGASSSTLFGTADGGRSWKRLFDCVAQVQIQGLTKQLACYLTDLVFPSARVGYALGGGYNGGFSVIFKTEDGGENWKTLFASSDVETIKSAAFTDESRGVVATRDLKMFLTEDGGSGWRGLPARLERDGTMRFADPSVGWGCWPRGCAVTTDGGITWASRALSLPATIKAFSAPRRDRVFLIGEHGMVYRYRIVPADYNAKFIHAAQLVPGYGAELRVPLAAMHEKVQALQAKAASGGEAVLKEPAFAQALAGLEADAGAIAGQTPSFAGRYRNLNVLHIGMNMLDDLKVRASAITDGVAALKGASDLKTASAALADLLARLDETSVAVSNGFDHLAAAEAAGAGAVRNMAVQSAPPGAQGQAQPAQGQQSQQSQGGSQAADQAAEQAKRLLQRLFR